MIFNEHINLFLKCLFNESPREVGFPYRLPKLINLDQISILCKKKHHDSPCFTALYKDNLNKIWVDFDDKDTKNEQLAFNDARTYYNRLLKLGINKRKIFLVYTGNKGFHIYVLNKSITISKKHRKDLHLVLTYLTRGLNTTDTPIFADIKRLTRIAGIQRTNNNFTILLNPEYIFNNYSSIYEYFKIEKFNYNKIITKSNKYLKKSLKDGFSVKGSKNREDNLQLILDHINKIKWKQKFYFQSPSFQKQIQNTIEYKQDTKKRGYTKAVDIVLKATLTKEDYLKIIAPNPVHKTRIRVSKKLLQNGFSANDVSDFFSSLGWIDFQYDKTMKNVLYIKDHYL